MLTSLELDLQKLCGQHKVSSRLEQLLIENRPAPSLEPKIRQALGAALAARSSRLQIIPAVCAALECQPNAGWLEVVSAFELLLPAYDIIDDVQDGKLSENITRLEMGQWLNAALYLLHAGLAVLDKAEFSRAALDKTRQRFHSLILDAVNGQAADLESETTLEMDTQAALEISRLKSGSFIQAIFESVATLAELDPDAVAQVGKIGQLTGTAWQLQSDLKDVCQELPEAALKDSDLGCYKKTVPIVFALNFARQYPSATNQVLLDYYAGQLTGLTATNYKMLCLVVQASGAPAYTQAVIEMHRSTASQLVAELSQKGYTQVGRLLSLFERK